MSKVFALLSTTMIVAGLITVATAADDEKPVAKHSTKEVMKDAHKSGLIKKVVGKTASDEERDQLVELYIAMAQNDAPKGSQKDWKILTSRLVVAAADAAEDPENVDALKKVTNCGACHKAHKPA